MPLGILLHGHPTRSSSSGDHLLSCKSVPALHAYPSCWHQKTCAQRCRHALPGRQTQRDTGIVRAESSPGSSSANGALQPAATSDCAVVIVDHGSRRAESNAQLQQFADLYRQHSGRDAVRIAHMEIASPSISDAVSELAQSGYREIVIAPYFLSNGRHITQDIPALVAEAQAAHPSVHCKIADPIGVDPLMAKLIEQRVASTLQQPSQSTAAPTPATAVTIEKE